jgi:hypothetical protein
MRILIAILLIVVTCGISLARDYYQIKIYSLSDDVQEQRMDRYLEKAFLPAMKRAGIQHVGVFKPVDPEADFGRYIMVLIPFKSLGEFEKIDGLLEKDKQYQSEAEDYINASHENVPYQRISSILLKAFKSMPSIAIPDHVTPRRQQVYELRSYEGPTEKMYRTKVSMFDDEGETRLFIDLGFRPVFFGEVISGPSMPNLMYMTTHENSIKQEENWEAFRSSDEWTRMKSIEKYRNTVSHIDKYIMYPTEYSGL